MIRFITTLMFLAALTSSVQAESPPAFVEKAATRDVIKHLRSGGFVLYMRHGTTDSSKPDRVPTVDLNDCSTQRPLTPEGLKMSVSLGNAIRRARIPVAEVVSSPLCRARESAQAAFGKDFRIDNHLMYTANLTSEEKKPIVAATRRLLSAPVARGGNRVIVAHAPNLFDLIGYFPKPEGTIVIFRPTGAGFDYVASIHPDSWDRLLQP